MTQLLTQTAKKSALLVCLSLLIGSGCTVKSRHIPVVVDGYWKTPSSKIEFESITLEDLRKKVYYESRSDPYALLLAHNDRYGVILNPYDITSTIAIYGGERKQKITIDNESSFFTLSCKEYPILRGKLLSPKNAVYGGHYSTGRAIITRMSSPSLAEITERRDLGGCILRYSFSYRTLGEEYLTDVKMKLKKDRYIDWDDWHFPGSP